jgi:hypothetical protein
VPILTYILYYVPYFSAVNFIQPGQSPVLFALLWLYHTFVPAVYRFQISPISSPGYKAQMSDKVFLYILAGQLACSHIPSSALGALVGWIAAGLIYQEFLPGKNWRVPFYRKLGLETQRVWVSSGGQAQ